MTSRRTDRLRGCAGPRRTFCILAIDHRNSLRKALDPASPGTVPDEALVAFKREVVSKLAPEATAVLLDPEYGLGQSGALPVLPETTGLIVSLERSGYTGQPDARVSETLPGWDAHRASEIGAHAVKLLVYYHPEAPTAPQVRTLVQRVGAACEEAEMPLFLEILTYLPTAPSSLSAPREHQRAVIEAARQLTETPGVSVLKAEFPVDTNGEPDEARWFDACCELTETSRVPWVLLSRGVSFETYLRQVMVATSAGASGIAVGRAVWQEATQLHGGEREAFLSTVARERLARLRSLCDKLARPAMG